MARLEKRHQEKMAHLKAKLDANPELSPEQKQQIINQMETQYQERVKHREAQQAENKAFWEEQKKKNEALWKEIKSKT